MKNTSLRILMGFSFFLAMVCAPARAMAQDLPPHYLTMELFTNTPCPICGSQNPGLFNRLQNYEGQYHLISFYPGKPYSSCIFYQANIAENTTRYQHYTGDVFGTPTVALNGIDFKNSSGVTNTVLNNLTGGTTWLHVDVEETNGTSRNVTITLDDVAGGSVSTGRLFAVIVEREIMYNAPNGETLHHNVFRKFLTSSAGEDIDMSTGQAVLEYAYEVDGTWNASETYVIAWLSNADTKEIYNSGSRFDPDFVSATDRVEAISPLALYPNPANTQVNLTLPEGLTAALLQVYTQQGQLISTQRIQDQAEYRISTQELPTGRYIIKLISGRTLYAGSFEVVR